MNHESLDSFLLLPIEIVVHNLLYENSVFKVYRLTLSFALPLDYFFSVLSMNFSLMQLCQSLRQTPSPVLTTQRLLRSSTFVFLDLDKLTFQRTFGSNGRKKIPFVSNGTAKVETFSELAKLFRLFFENSRIERTAAESRKMQTPNAQLINQNAFRKRRKEIYTSLYKIATYILRMM